MRGQEVSGKSKYAGLVCEGPCLARQEYALQADTKYQLTRFGVNPAAAVSGEMNTDLDLTAAFAAVEAAVTEWMKVPPVVRSRYGSFARLQAAALSGELDQFMTQAGLAAGSSGAKPAGGASDSAPVEGGKA